MRRVPSCCISSSFMVNAVHSTGQVKPVPSILHFFSASKSSMVSIRFTKLEAARRNYFLGRKGSAFCGAQLVDTLRMGPTRVNKLSPARVSLPPPLDRFSSSPEGRNRPGKPLICVCRDSYPLLSLGKTFLSLFGFPHFLSLSEEPRVLRRSLRVCFESRSSAVASVALLLDHRRRRRDWLMGFFEASIIHHVGGVLALTWALAWFGRYHLLVYLLSLAYLYMVHEQYIKRLRRKLQFEERKHASQRRLLSDAESLRWLNHAVEKVWPMCMEQIASQRFLLPIIPWFLDKFKPWTAKKATLQNLYLGRSPPAFTEIRVVHPSTDDDHLVLELGMNFLSADDMSAVLAVKLRKRLGFGMWAKLHVTGIHVEGRVLVGLKFLRRWPFVGRLRLCFVDPPFFQVTVKPIFSHGLDVTEIPGISGWVDSLLAAAFAETLVEPNMLVVDVEKFVESPEENWFTVDEKCSIAYARVEILEGADMNPSDLNGLADPYVRGNMGPCLFQTTIKRKTLAPKWLEVFKIPITSWEAAVLRLEVRDKDLIFDDSMGVCSVDMAELRGGQRHDLWLTLKEVKKGRLHLAITVTEGGDATGDSKKTEEGLKEQLPKDGAAAAKTGGEGDGDVYEAVDIQGQEKTGVWIHQPGAACASHRWEPRKGKEGQPGTELHGEAVISSRSSSSPAENSDDDDEGDVDNGDKKSGHKKLGKIQRKLKKVGGLLIKTPREGSDSPPSSENPLLGEAQSPPEKGKGRRDTAMGMLRQVGNSAQNHVRKVLSNKGSKKNMDRVKEEEEERSEDCASSIDEGLSTTPAAAETWSHDELGAGERARVERPPSRKVSLEKGAAGTSV